MTNFLRQLKFWERFIQFLFTRILPNFNIDFYLKHLGFSMLKDNELYLCFVPVALIIYDLAPNFPTCLKSVRIVQVENIILLALYAS